MLYFDILCGWASATSFWKLQAMGWTSLPKDVWVQCLDYLSDDSILELAVASPNFKCTLIESRRTGGGGPWRHPPGTWQPAGLWRVLNFSCLSVEMKSLPAVILHCDIEFKDPTEVSKFFHAAKTIASDTVDGRVMFSKFSFDPRESADLFSGFDDGAGNWCGATPNVPIVFKGVEMECCLEAQCFDFELGQDLPSLHLGCACWDDHPVLEGLGLCCRPLISPEVRLKVSWDTIYEEHLLDATSPLSTLVRAGEALPIFFGVGRMRP